MNPPAPVTRTRFDLRFPPLRSTHHPPANHHASARKSIAGGYPETGRTSGAFCAGESVQRCFHEA